MAAKKKTRTRAGKKKKPAGKKPARKKPARKAGEPVAGASSLQALARSFAARHLR